MPQLISHDMFMDHRLDLWTGHAEKMMQNMMVAVMTDTNQEIADIKKPADRK